MHDDGRKRVLGKRGRFDGDDVVAMLADHPATSRRVVRSLWAEFVPGELTPALEATLAQQFRRTDGDVAALLEAILLSPAFWATSGRQAMFKSPVELIVGTLRMLDVQPPERQLRPLVLGARAMGQELFNPPNVAGWSGGEDWITTGSLLVRETFLARVAGRARRAPNGGEALVAVLLEPTFQLK